jgi:glycosyltransferase involved in cell wall biosynthesis
MEPAGEHAMYFHKGDVDDLRQKLAYLLDNPDVIARYKADAADYVCERYNWDIVVDQMLDMYSGRRIVDYKEYIPGGKQEK